MARYGTAAGPGGAWASMLLRPSPLLVVVVVVEANGGLAEAGEGPPGCQWAAPPPRPGPE